MGTHTTGKEQIGEWGILSGEQNQVHKMNPENEGLTVNSCPEVQMPCSDLKGFVL
jgi:hypothetical protein